MNLATVDLRLLKVFTTVAETGGFTQAAAALNVGRPTISTQMADLEARLGMRLCERGRAGFALTASGEEVLKHTERLFAAVEDFKSHIDDMHGNLTGELNVAMIDYMSTVPDFRIADVLRDFADQAPDVHLHFKVLPEEELTRALLDGRIHLGITSGHKQYAGIDYAGFLGEDLFVYCGRGHELYDKPDSEIDRNRLMRMNWADQCVWPRDAAAAPDSGRDAHANNLEAILVLILSGRYIGQLPDFFAEPWVKRGDIRIVARDLTYERNKLMIATRTGHRRTGPVDAFLKLLYSCHRTES